MHLLDDKLLAAQLERQIRGLGHVHGQRIERSHLVQMQQATVLLEGRMRFTLRASKGFQLNGIVHQLAYLGQKAGVLRELEKVVKEEIHKVLPLHFLTYLAIRCMGMVMKQTAVQLRTLARRTVRNLSKSAAK